MTPKQCPFCGWNEIYLEHNIKIGDKPVYICEHCQALAPFDIWDNRPIEDEFQSRIDEINDVLLNVYKLKVRF